ncbi:MAG: protein kinase [Phycisphaerae bacterium]|nr:protein kinase [Phycisphaerae bacterium]
MMTIGQVVLRYFQIVDLLPSGGQADLAKAVDLRTGQPVVVKKLLASPSASQFAVELARFKRAATLRINHPCVVNPLLYGQEGDAYYVVFPFVDGLDLETFMMKQRGPAPLNVAVSIVVQLRDVLSAVHDEGVVHRDIKPANLILVRDGTIRLIDFGVCRIIGQPTISQQPGMLGTPWWLAPEQQETPWNAGIAADLYGAGAVLYYLLTGQPPFQSQDTAAGAARVRTAMPIPPHHRNPDVPEQLSAICLNLLAKDPAARCSSAKALKHALEGGPRPEPTAGRCMSCRTPLAANSRFCTCCGLPQEIQSHLRPRCIACGHNVANQDWCPGCQRRFSAANHRLCFFVGPLFGAEYRIPEGTYSVGRYQLLPQDHCLSRHHFSMTCLNGSVILQDANSANGTYVHGQRADLPILLRPNDELRIGNYKARFYSN